MPPRVTHKPNFSRAQISVTDTSTMIFIIYRMGILHKNFLAFSTIETVVCRVTSGDPVMRFCRPRLCGNSPVGYYLKFIFASHRCVTTGPILEAIPVSDANKTSIHRGTINSGNNTQDPIILEWKNTSAWSGKTTFDDRMAENTPASTAAGMLHEPPSSVFLEIVQSVLQQGRHIIPLYFSLNGGGP